MDTNMIKEIIEEAVTKRDRSVSIYFSPETGMSISVYPWPDAEACSEMFRRGEISLSEYHRMVGIQATETCSGDACDINLHAVDPSDWGAEK